MTTTIERIKSRSGKRTLFVPTIEGIRIGRTNFCRLWEAKKVLNNFLDANTEEEIKELIIKYKSK